jgi:SAM-dependent methyltransferase
MRVEELEKMYRLEDAYWWFVGRRRLVHALLRRYGPPQPRLLDVGCGTGGTLDEVRDEGELWGVDVAREALEFCRQRGHRGLGQCTVEALPFAADSFDVALCCDILEHLDDDRAGLAEVLRVLRPGGIAIVTLPAYPWLWSEHDVALSHRRRYDRASFRAALKGFDVRIVKLTYGVTLVFPVVLAVRVLSRLRIRRLGQPHTQLMSMPGWANRLLIGLQALEAQVVSRFGFPFGTSLVAVLRKPGEPVVR